ncbi:putative membrane protein [Propionispora sp. 2/2-37]|uniref:basic amino acid ABC transporter substrate-binding protein n=1 Tax=Propionispora sp. 2/2-37 TaxID=1677858 RepID=UPI0006BB97C5|nr:basic amino acid ABC transporter substrate-binding protein [Propionispora sp. 2/2-37]CUH94412.1 putative membrane protein [Propionispora sp. 2/2-37]
MSKKTIAYLLMGVLLLALGLTGCGGQQPAGGGEKAAVLKVGTEPSFAPFEFQGENDKEYAGFDMDLIRAIGKQMGMQVEIQSMGFDGLIPALEAGNIDVVISGMTITDERVQKVSFSKPYYKSGLTIVTKQGNDQIKGFGDLAGKRIGVQIGTTGADEAKKIKDAQVREFNTPPEAFMELKAGGVDAVINDKPVNDYYMKEAGSKDAQQVGEPLTSEDYGIATAKKNTELSEKINKALDELKKNGEYDKIYEKWFGKKP